MGSNVFGRGIRNEKILSFFYYPKRRKGALLSKELLLPYYTPLTLIGFSSIFPNFLLYRETAH